MRDDIGCTGMDLRGTRREYLEMRGGEQPELDTEVFERQGCNL